MKDYERKFKCRVWPNEWNDDKYEIKITNNGYQWSTVTADNLDQLIEIRDKITAFIDTKQKEEI